MVRDDLINASTRCGGHSLETRYSLHSSGRSLRSLLLGRAFPPSPGSSLVPGMAVGRGGCELDPALPAQHHPARGRPLYNKRRLRWGRARYGVVRHGAAGRGAGRRDAILPPPHPLPPIRPAARQLAAAGAAARPGPCGLPAGCGSEPWDLSPPLPSVRSAAAALPQRLVPRPRLRAAAPRCRPQPRSAR